MMIYDNDERETFMKCINKIDVLYKKNVSKYFMKHTCFKTF